MQWIKDNFWPTYQIMVPHIDGSYLERPRVFATGFALSRLGVSTGAAFASRERGGLAGSILDIVWSKRKGAREGPQFRPKPVDRACFLAQV